MKDYNKNEAIPAHRSFVPVLVHEIVHIVCHVFQGWTHKLVESFPKVFSQLKLCHALQNRELQFSLGNCRAKYEFVFDYAETFGFLPVF